MTAAGWLRGELDAVRAHALTAPMGSSAEGWRCNPRCSVVLRTVAARSRHRVECASFAGWLAQARLQLGLEIPHEEQPL